LALQGTLDTFALPDVLRLLATTAKTGRLRIEGDRGAGSVWLRDGTVMAATADRAVDDAPAEEVLFELLRFEEGSFSFDMDELSPDGEQPEDVEVLLRNSGALLSEWSELKTAVPSLDHRVALVESLPSDDVTIDANRWPTLVAIGAGRSVGDLGQALGLGELSVSRAVRDLVDLGVISIEPPGPADVPPAPRTDSRAHLAMPRTDSPVRDASPPRPETAPREVARRGPFGSLGSGEMLGTAGAVHNADAMTTAEMQRAGWLQSPERTSGSTPAVPGDGAPAVRDDLSPGPRNGAKGNGGGAVSMTRPPGPPGASTSRFSGRSASAGKRSSPRPGPSARSSSLNGRSTTPGRRSSGPVGAGSGIGDERASASSPERPSGGAHVEPWRGSTRPPVPPRRSGPRLTPPTFERGGLSTPPGFDSGPFVPSSLPPDTGQIRPVSPGSLPPDLHWAADDASPLGRGGLGAGLHNGMGNGGSRGGPAVPPPVPVDPSKVAPHVAALSPEARAAVQATAGNSGGSTGPANGDDVADRGQLLNFLSSVRP